MKEIYVLFFLSLVSISLLQAQVVLVAADATGNNDETSWADAYTGLQDAIAFVNGTSGSYQIWVKAGTYYPTTTTDRSIRFELTAPSTKLYGGFNGTESLLADRDPKANVTILSGNIGDPGLATDNSYSLINFASVTQVIDGFTIQDIYGGTSYPDTYGAVYQNPGLFGHIVSNCIFKNNYGPINASTVYMNSNLSELSNCIFMNNDGPAVVAVYSGTSKIESNLFINNPNSVAIDVSIFSSGYDIVNNTFYNNLTGTTIAGNNHEVYNNIYWGNGTEISPGSAILTHNIIEGTTDPNNYDFDPGFKDAMNEDFSLSVCSAARNLGINTKVTLSEDIAGNTRIFDTTVDLGAYEVQGFDIQINAIETLGVACFGESTGQAGVGATGGVGDLEYSLDGTNYQSNAVFSDLPSGSYSLYVRDADGCMDTDNFTINELSASVLTASITVTNVACHGDATGEISVAASGGTAPYEYSLDGTTYQSSTTFASLGAGSFNVYVRDIVGCVKTYSTTVNEPTEITLTTFVIHDVSCNGASDGSIDVEATGGNGGAFTYSIAANSSSRVSYTSLINLAAGDYEITVADGLGCEAVFPATVTEPDALDATLAITDLPCKGTGTGSIDALATGGTAPYEYSIDGGSNYQSTEIFSGLTLGAYTLIVKDANNCTITAMGIISEPDALTMTLSGTDLQCNNDSSGDITASVSGGTAPYEYSLDGVNFQSSNEFTSLAAGSNQVTVKDANGCETDQSITLLEPNKLTITATFDGSQVIVSGAGGTLPYLYAVGNETPQASDSFVLGNGQYTFLVIDDNGCEATTDQQILVTGVDPTSLVNVKIFPNPVQDKLYLSSKEKIREVSFVGMDGRIELLKNSDTHNRTIDVSGLKKGYYVIRIEFERGETIYQKLIKE